MSTRTLLLISICTVLQIGVQAQYLAENSASGEPNELFEAGERAYRSGDRAAAIGFYDQVLAADPDHVNALLQRGFCHSLQRSYEKSVQDFSAVIRIKNDHSWAYTSRGSAYSKLGKHEMAIADFNKVLALDPRNEEAYNNRGWARKATGDLKSACKDWDASKRMGNAEAKIIMKNNHCK